MDPFKEVLDYCVFCLRDPVSSLQTHSSSDVANKFDIFIKIFSRFVEGQESKLVMDLGLSSLECCKECLNMVNKFCDLYHQYKCLELQLDWIVWTIERIIRFADKVPSRVSRAKNITMEADTNGKGGWDSVIKLRDDINAKCKLKLARSLPRLSLQRNVPSLPVLYQPVFISSSNESLNVTLDSKIEQYSNPVESEQSEEFEDTVAAQDDYDTESNGITDETIKPCILNNVEQNKASEENDTTCVSNSTTVILPPSALAIENIVTAISPEVVVCKPEPQNYEENQTEDNVEEKCSLIPTKPYNLRRISKPTAQEIDDDDQVDIKKINLDNSSNMSTSSSSDTSSESSFSEDENCDNKLSIRKIRKLREKYKSRSNYQRYFYCKSANCRKKFTNKQMYENHSKLHSNGKFPCNFCSKVKLSLVQLCHHEHKMHGKSGNHLSKNESRWHCPRCPFKSGFVSDYEAHFASTHFGVGTEPPQRRVFEKCKICNREVWNKAMHSHFKASHDIRTLNDSKIKRCKKLGCSAYFINKWQLNSHNRLEHKIEQERETKPRKRQCNVCLKTFAQYLTLQRHYLQIHKYQLRKNFKNQPAKNDISKIIVEKPELITGEDANKQFKCKFCPVIKVKPSDLAIHEAEKHPPNYSGNLKKASCCPRCPYKYTLKRAYVKHHLQVHLNLLNSESPSACKLCSDGKVYKANSEQHFRNSHQIDDGMEPYKCDKCPAYFRKSYQLQLHAIKIHQQDPKCEVCDKYFKTRMTLASHMNKSHPGNDENPDLPLACDFGGGCKKRFRTQGELEHHKKYGHQRPGWSRSAIRKRNEKAKCANCGEEFTGISYLNTHLVKVHGERPFVCDDCGKTFKSKTVLDLHSDFHKRPEEWKWQCADCGKKCTTRQKLEEHGRTHTKEKPFVCQFCGEKYAHRHNWRGHLKAKHGDEDGVEEMIGEKKKGNYLKRKGTKKGDCIIATK